MPHEWSSKDSATNAAKTLCEISKESDGKVPLELVAAYRALLETARPAVVTTFYEYLGMHCPGLMRYFLILPREVEELRKAVIEKLAEAQGSQVGSWNLVDCKMVEDKWKEEGYDEHQIAARKNALPLRGEVWTFYFKFKDAHGVDHKFLVEHRYGVITPLNPAVYDWDTVKRLA
jgi:hypothetical protein